ncbi:MAG: malonic semialdehyde reductase [Gammaproteobacteria bacterium]|nr:MAG: malonic semialdehyde reductase [Gammaproteobacteria bacterium]|tara:strand:+ start:1888 stop:2550 length:663 start_codon:yes stop_codon:yes gene_type:complete
MIELSEEQKKAVADAQETFIELKDSSKPLNNEQLNLLFGQARSMNGWQDKEVSDGMVKSIYELTKMGPTSTNCCPARFKFIKSDEAKENLKEALLPNNVPKVMTAPVIALIGYDLDFADNMGKLFPHMDVAPMYKNNDEMNTSTAFRNSSLQGAYFMMVSRALGLDCGPMSGFNNQLVDEKFFAGTNIKSNFLCCIGYGDPSKIFMRLPRLDFEDVCEII